MDVDEKLQAIDLRLQEIEGRLSRLEHPSTSTAPLIAEDDRRGRLSSIDLGLIGQSLLILGGAFLLRAATETATLPKNAGVALGFAYAVAWIVVAITAARAGRRTASIFYAAAASIVAYPILWEATTRFGVLTANLAAIILALFSIALIVAGRMLSMQWLAWIAAAGATLDALLLAYATKALIPFLLELTAIGTVALLLSLKYVGWLLAIESDLFALLLILMTLLDEKRPEIIPVLIIFAAAWLLKPGVQAVAGALIGFGGAAAIVLLRNIPAMPVAIPALIAAAILLALSFKRDEMYDSIAGAIAALSGSLLLLSPLGRSLAWGLAAVAAAEIARRKSSATFAAQSTIWGALAVFGSIPIAAALCFIAYLRKRSIVLLAIATGGALIVIPATGLLRTTILSAASVGLAIAGRRIKDAAQLAIVALIVTGVQVIAEDVRGGNATTMFIALAVYGGAMLAIAPLRKAWATS